MVESQAIRPATPAPLLCGKTNQSANALRAEGRVRGSKRDRLLARNPLYGFSERGREAAAPATASPEGTPRLSLTAAMCDPPLAQLNSPSPPHPWLGARKKGFLPPGPLDSERLLGPFGFLFPAG